MKNPITVTAKVNVPLTLAWDLWTTPATHHELEQRQCRLTHPKSRN